MKLKRIVFMGTPQFAIPTLELLAKTRFCPVICITQPDKPKGRKQRLTSPEVKTKALKLNIPVIQPEDVNSTEMISKLKEINPDIIITVAYGGYLKKEIRKLPKFGCINIHPSLLPKHRGPAPINYALFNGDKTTGNTVFKITAKMDSGPIVHQSEINIEDNENYTELYERLSKIGAEDILKVLETIEKEGLNTISQDHSKATFSHKIMKEDTYIDWSKPAKEIRNKVRGLSETPGAVASFRNLSIKIIEVEILNKKTNLIPGDIIEVIKNKGIVVATADNDILLRRVQPSGKKIMTSHAFSLGARIESGEKFNNGF
ncbi:MAG: methionyl-tRNA formyltransferase [Candidatus Cloacimonetes bacterium]|nr:methionyl-tRNA formyltransferase [Candidatus Cloacimonadota bacterium]